MTDLPEKPDDRKSSHVQWGGGQPFKAFGPWGLLLVAYGMTLLTIVLVYLGPEVTIAVIKAWRAK